MSNGEKRNIVFNSHLISFPKDISSLRVPKNHPVQSQVLQHGWTDFTYIKQLRETGELFCHTIRTSCIIFKDSLTCESTFGNLVTILSRDRNACWEQTFGILKVGCRTSNNNLCKRKTNQNLSHTSRNFSNTHF